VNGLAIKRIRTKLFPNVAERRGYRCGVGVDRLPPQPEPREDVVGHVQGVRHRRRDRGVILGRGQSILG
jgi:hypothetical protein